MAGIQFRDSKNGLKAFLSEHPTEWAVALAIRAATRIAPILVSETIPSVATRQALSLRVLRDLNAAIFETSWPQSGGNRWKIPREEDLVFLWKSGLSATEIGKQIGGFSRNAVVGKARRMGLESQSYGEVVPRIATIMNLAKLSSLLNDPQRKAANAVAYVSSSIFNFTRGHAATGYSNAHRAIRFAEEAYCETLDIANALPDDLPKCSFMGQVEADATRLASGLSASDLLIRTNLWDTGALPLPQAALASFEWEFWRDWYLDRLKGRDGDGPSNVGPSRIRSIYEIPLQIWSIGPQGVSDYLANPPQSPVNDLFHPDISTDLSKLDNVEQQYPFAATFHTNSEGLIDFDDRSANLSNQTGDSLDRYNELVDVSQELQLEISISPFGSNSTNLLQKYNQKLLDALGASIINVRPGLLIPRGERLRILLESQNNDDEFGNDPPLPVNFLNSLKALVAAYNIFIAMDPTLSAYDDARISPIEEDNLVDPNLSLKIISESVNVRVSTGRARDILLDISANIVDYSNINKRSSRTFLEASRNFFRATIYRSIQIIKLSFKIGVPAVGGAYASVLWVTKNAIYLESFFPSSSTMIGIIKQIAEIGRPFL